jgi:enoyl-CoA hydratase/isomerase-like protein
VDRVDSVLGAADALEWLDTPDVADDVSGTLLTVDLGDASTAQMRAIGQRSRVLRALPCVTLAIAPMLELVGPDREWTTGFDVVVDREFGVDPDVAVAVLTKSVRAHPHAAVTAAQVVRATSRLDVASGLAVESLAYSMLQAGPEFNTWLQARPAVRPAAIDAVPILATREGNELVLTFNRPEVRNAFNVATRDGLVELLRGPGSDPEITRIVLRGAGPSFCSGGDLNEFGTFPDPAAAHAARVTRSAAWWVSTVGPRLRAELHGACVGAGIELAAWAAEVVAADDTFGLLPEVSMGLIPGAGGTVSLPRRIGRHRTAYLAISGERVDVERMHAWGLVDRIEGVG